MFADRVEAGRRLADELAHLGGDAVVLGLPRGGVPVAAVVAERLGAPLDVIVVRKLGVPFQPELAMGAIGEGGVRVVNDEVVRVTGVDAAAFGRVEERERAELVRRARRFRGSRRRVPLEGRTAVIVDDGIATGSTARAACEVARALGASRVVLAVPVAPPGWDRRMGDAADEYVSVATPEPFRSIGQFYTDFRQTPDAAVVESLERAARRASPPHPGRPPGSDEEVVVTAGPHRLGGRLTVPEAAPGIVVFAHGSGSSRHSPRNRYVAGLLNQAGLGTLLFDLLTPDEEADRANVFDIALLAGRLGDATAWLRAALPGEERPLIGYFGASTGAAAALWAAAEPGAGIAAVVSRGGRPDLAGDRLSRVSAPTLLIVGGDDHPVLALNRRAQAELGGESRLVVVSGATHLFEEPGTLQSAAEAARDWLVERLAPAGPE